MRIQILGDSNLKDDGTTDAEHDGQDRHPSYGRSLGHDSANLQRVETRKLLISHTWQGKKGRLGTPMSPKKKPGLRL